MDLSGGQIVAAVFALLFPLLLVALCICTKCHRARHPEHQDPRPGFDPAAALAAMSQQQLDALYQRASAEAGTSNEDDMILRLLAQRRQAEKDKEKAEKRRVKDEATAEKKRLKKEKKEERMWRDGKTVVGSSSAGGADASREVKCVEVVEVEKEEKEEKRQGENSGGGEGTMSPEITVQPKWTR